MPTVIFETGQKVQFDKTPTQQDIDEVALKLGIKKSTTPQKTGLEKTAGVLDAVLGGGKIGEAIGTGIAKNNIMSTKDVVLPDYSKFTPEVKQRLIQKGIPTTEQGQRQEVADSIKGPTAMQVAGDVGRVALNFAPVGKIAEGLATGLKAIPLLGKIAKPVANLATGAGTGALFQGASNVAEGKPFGEDIGTGASIGAAIPGLGILGNGVAKATRGALGLTTGEGSGSLGKLVEAFRQGGEQGDLARSAMRGHVNQEDLAKDTFGALGKIMDDRRSNYQSQLENLKTKASTIDHMPIYQSLDDQLKKFNVTKDAGGKLDLSRSPGLARYGRDLDQLQTILNTWGTKPGDNTIAGIDKLKQVIDDFRIGTPESARFDSFITSLKNDAKGLISKGLEGDQATKAQYEKMLNDYHSSSEDIQDAQKLLALGGKNNEDQAFQRLSKVFKGNSDMKKRLLEELNQASGGKLVPQIVGTQFRNVLPGFARSTVAGLGAFATGSGSGGAILPALASLTAFSPRIVGELSNILGLGLKGRDMLENLLVGKGASRAISPGDSLLNKMLKKKTK